MSHLAEFADGFCQMLWRNAWQISILILLVLVANWALRRKLSHGWRYALWLLVLVRLAWPYPPQSSWSVFNLFARDTEPAKSASSAAPTQPGTVPAQKAAPEAAVPSNPATAAQGAAGGSAVAHAKNVSQGMGASAAAARPFPTTLILLQVWLAGVLILGGRVVWEALKLGNSIRRLRPSTDPLVTDLLEDCKELMNVTTPMAVIESAQVQYPMLHGFLRPRLLLPEGLLARLGPEQLRHVFLHELAHVRRCDILVNWLATWLQILHWFNPLVWLAFWCMRNERELTADRLALSSAPENERLEYGETLLALTQLFRARRYLPSLAGILEVKGQIETRIIEIANFDARTRRPLLALAVFIALAIATLTDAQRASVEPEDADSLADFEQGGSWQRRASGPTQNGPSARVGHSMIWTGRELIVWGGGSQSVFFNDGGRYDLATDTWRPISQRNAPSPRWFHAAVWTGREMIVWGGRAQFNSDQVRNDGARYDPVTDTWTSLPAENAPAARSQMGAVWTGTEMLIWGGTGEGWVIEPVGARYNPQTDIWKPLSVSNAPEPRMEPSTVWTGREMLAWGGLRLAPDHVFYNTGGRYDPARDEWVALPTNAAPTARARHTAVWTGSEMIVWGGAEDIRFHNTGARFNPAKNTWTPTSVVRAAQRRLGHCAVWTGSEMIVWGGHSTPYDLTSGGGRYNPVTDEWSHVTTIGAPAARQFQRDDGAVWTGEGMLIFGGGTGRKEFDSNYLWIPPSLQKPAIGKTFKESPAPGFGRSFAMRSEAP